MDSEKWRRPPFTFLFSSYQPITQPVSLVFYLHTWTQAQRVNYFWNVFFEQLAEKYVKSSSRECKVQKPVKENYIDVIIWYQYRYIYIWFFI